jgi:hypothetical protein
MRAISRPRPLAVANVVPLAADQREVRIGKCDDTLMRLARFLRHLEVGALRRRLLDRAA